MVTPMKNTDRELWRECVERGDDPMSYYSNRIFVTEDGGIGIDVGGTVIVKPLREWHELASRSLTDYPYTIPGHPGPEYFAGLPEKYQNNTLSPSPQGDAGDGTQCRICGQKLVVSTICVSCQRGDNPSPDLAGVKERLDQVECEPGYSLVARKTIDEALRVIEQAQARNRVLVEALEKIMDRTDVDVATMPEHVLIRSIRKIARTALGRDEK
jgi:hypothetical protein